MSYRKQRFWGIWNTSQTGFDSVSNASQTLFKRFANRSQTPYKPLESISNTFQTLCKCQSNGLQSASNASQTLFKRFANDSLEGWQNQSARNKTSLATITFLIPYGQQWIAVFTQAARLKDLYIVIQYNWKVQKCI